MRNKEHWIDITQYTAPNNSSKDPDTSLRNNSSANEEIIQHVAAFLLGGIASSSQERFVFSSAIIAASWVLLG